MPENLQEQLDKYLADVHAIEQQALAQLRSAPKIAGDDELAAMFREHERETEGQERRVRERLEARGAKPSLLKDIAGRVTGVPFVLFARSQPDTPGKLVAHSYSYEHLELAAYELLEDVARRAADDQTIAVARANGGQERAMADRLRTQFDRAVEVSLRVLAPDDLTEQLVKYLADAHAIEAQAIQLLEKAHRLAGDPELTKLYEEHLAETQNQQAMVERRLRAHGAKPSAVKDAAMRLGALNWSAFFAAQPDTPAKLAGFAFAFEHLEVASYELLKRVAQRAGDVETVTVAEQILGEERTAASRIEARFERAMEASLQAQGVVA
jgi:ferritin-like metal-binding protein YciE